MHDCCSSRRSRRSRLRSLVRLRLTRSFVAAWTSRVHDFSFTLHYVSKKTAHFYFCNNFAKCQPIFILFRTVAPEQITNNLTYVLPVAPNVCSCTTLAKINCQFSTCLTLVLLIVFPQNIFWYWAGFWHLCRITAEENVKKTCCTVWYHTYFWVSLPYSKPRNINWCNKGGRSRGQHDIQKVKEE